MFPMELAYFEHTKCLKDQIPSGTVKEEQEIQAEMLAVGQNFGCLDKSRFVFCCAKDMEVSEFSIESKPGAVDYILMPCEFDRWA